MYRLEFLLLALAAPFLLFPTLKPEATLAVLVLLALFWMASLARRRPWPVTPFNGALLLFAVMVGVGVGVSALPDLTLPKATGLILGLGLFRWAAGMRGDKGRRVALALFLLAGAGVWGMGLLGTAWSLKVPGLQVWLERLPGQVVLLPAAPEGGINPNQLAGVMALLLPLPVAVLLEGRFSWRDLPRRLLGLAGAVVWGGTLFLTQSRGGWVGGLVGLLTLFSLWGLSGRRRWQRGVGLALPLLALAAGVALVVHLGPEQVGEFLYGVAQRQVESPVGTITVQGRIEIWSRALYAIQDFPFTGCGLGAFRRVVWVLYPPFGFPPGHDFAHAHNVFLQTALDLGLPGLVAYLALLGLAGAVGWQAAVSTPGPSPPPLGPPQTWEGGGGGVGERAGVRAVALGLLSGLVGLHVYGLADALALGSRPNFLFWWMLGLLAALAGEGESKKDE